MDTNWTEIVQAIASIIAIPGGIAGFIVLFKKDLEKQKRIEFLEKQFVQQVKLNELQERKIRLSVKPRIWCNSSGIIGNKIEISINNRGNLAFYDGFVFISGEYVEFSEWNEPIQIKSDGEIKITGYIKNKNLSDIVFTGKLLFHDQENYAYETYLDWKSGKCTFSKTEEL